ncbi:isovaleryl-CoA dehydrogenase [Janthinobacterium psychrotolerans]|uniref:Putative acyl-CoA dehydrogenase n=1 Tax=Janthinobacterium psychrotolerans TaxID=1747903 RepID=A0A1A7BX06_9BURK|nr:isovaleryl-CoA dehydrogenase [Janthinobacterium psychrotolerans]OBV38131.1 putative acyl-CoA dehydrogenase [Janthinobacterium psychrotolerans]
MNACQLPANTHEVFNQATPFENINLYTCDPALQEAVRREGGGAASACLAALGERLGSAELMALAQLANVHGPQLQQFDRSGRRIDEVTFHPAWHGLMEVLVKAGLHAAPWVAPAAGAGTGTGTGTHVARAAAYILVGQLENGVQCPLTMTFASVPVLRQATGLPQIMQRWLPKILSSEYDPRSLPVEHKRGALIGMGMTEKQGGTDVRSNTTCAEALPLDQAQALFGAEANKVHRIVGHKWFFSVPQSDAHLILAQDAGGAGLSCFFLPRYLPDGSRNAIRVQRLKDKLGNRSNASAEVEFAGAYGWLLGAAGRGIATIIDMASHTRLDCVLGSAGIMRAALSQALHHARQRMAFGKVLAEQPLMQNVLADLALESEAATVFAMRLARCFDEKDDQGQAALARVLTPAGKYWICKRGPGFGAEAMEVLGGIGYVEEAPLARLYRELPVNSIWEGSGNVMCLDVLRALARSPAARVALAAELALGGDADATFVACRARLLQTLEQGDADEFDARKLAERIVLAVQAALLLRHAPACVSSAFVATRLAQAPGGAYGRLPAGTDCAAILARALHE